MQNTRCGHYLPETEMLVVSGSPVVMRVPVRRCLLSEHMIAQIIQTERGREVARKLTLALTHLPEPAPADEAQTGSEPLRIRAALGPDLEPIHQSECLASRCLQSCTISYKSMLEQFGLTTQADELSTGCLEATELPEEAI